MSCDPKAAPEIASAPDGPLQFEIKLTSDPRLLAVVRGAILKMAAASGFEEDHCHCITLAVDEAMSNIIRHAYKNRTDREIELTCRAHDECLEFTFLDGGEAPDPSRICGEPLNDTAPGGRGTHLIRQIMDEVHYERTGGRNRLELKKYLPCAGGKNLPSGKCEA